MLQKAIPLLPSTNLRATIDFYETRLGFGGVNMGSYAIIQSGFAEIHFYLVAGKDKLHPCCCIIYTDNLEDLYTVFAAKDMLLYTGKLAEATFGRKEFSIKDGDGNIIRFSKQ